MKILQEATEALPGNNNCGMHIPVARLVKHRRKARCKKATEIWIRWIYVEMVERCGDMELSLQGREGNALAEGV